MTTQDQYELNSEFSSDGDEQFCSEYTEWDKQGNVIARGWNAHPDRCEHCGAWGEDDHMLSCPDYVHQDKSPLETRTVIRESVDSEGISRTLSPLPIGDMQSVFAALRAAGRVGQHEGSGCCLECGGKECMTISYLRPGCTDGDTFEICIQCWMVWEHTYEEFKPELKEAITDHTDGLPTIERIAAVQRDTSRVSKTASVPGSSTSAGALYAES